MHKVRIAAIFYRTLDIVHCRMSTKNGRHRNG